LRVGWRPEGRRRSGGRRGLGRWMLRNSD
jgi:hypothetical protein